MTAEISAPVPPKPSMSPFLRALLGLLLLLPACGLCSVNLVGTTADTILAGFQANPLSNDTPEFVGMENFESLFDIRNFGAAVEFTGQLILVRLLVAAVIPLLLSIGVYQLGKRSRLAIRLLFTLPMAFFAPALVAFASRRMLWMWDRDSTEMTVLLVEALTMLIVSCAAGLLVYSAVLRRRAEEGKDWTSTLPALIAVWLIGQFAVLAYTLQTFLPLGFFFRSGSITFSQFAFETTRVFTLQLGFAASVIVFLPVAVLGVLATLTLILFRLQLEHVPPVEDANRTGNKMLGILGWLMTLPGAISVIFILFVPYLVSLLGAASWAGEGSTRSVSMMQVWLNTTLPPLLVILFIQLPFAYLGALGIGVVRPFGRWSDALLLLFAPWLFATSMPFALQRTIALSNADALDSFSALVPPLLISVPMLVILTLFFKGHAQAWRQALAEGTPAARAFFTKLFIPSLPLAGFLAALSFMAMAQDLIYSLLTGVRPEQFTAAGAILRFAGVNLLGSEKVIAAVGLPLFLIFSAIFIALRIRYLDRLTLGREPSVTGQAKPE